MLLTIMLVVGAVFPSASEDMDAKIRKITEMFGLSSDPTDNDTPSLPEMLKSISDLQQASYDCRDELDVQTVRFIHRSHENFAWKAKRSG